MNAKFSSIVFCAIFSLSLIVVKANTSFKVPITDSICCDPDSLKVVSVNYPVFCVSWKIPADSTCKHPFGFTVQWKPYPSSDPWSEKIIIYTGGTTINFCDSVDTCRNFQWRIRTICDTLNGGTYSNWVYGNKFSMNCGIHRSINTDRYIIKTPAKTNCNIVTISTKFRKPDDEKYFE